MTIRRRYVRRKTPAARATAEPTTTLIPPHPHERYKIPLKPEAHDALVRTLESMRARADAELRDYKKKIQLWRDLYSGNVKPKWKPWTDASEVYFPLIRMVADTAKARMMQTRFQQRDVATVESPMQESDFKRQTGLDLRESLSCLARFINYMALEPTEWDFKGLMDEKFGEQTVVGTAPVRTFHDFLRYEKKKVIGEDGRVATLENHVVKDRIRGCVVPVEQCFWDTTSDDARYLRFFGYDYTVSPDELRELARDQQWDKARYEKILQSPDTTLDEPTKQQRDREHVTSVTPGGETVFMKDGRPYRVSPYARYTLTEVEIRNSDVDDDGTYEDALVVWHRGSGQVPRCILWPYVHGEMTTDVTHYEKIRSRLIGSPVAEPGVSLAAGANSIVNQTIDAQSIRNCPNLATTDGETADLLREQGWEPGQVYVENVTGEVRVVEFAGAGNAVVSLQIFDKLVEAMYRITHLGPSQFGDVAQAQRIPSGIGESIMAEGAQLLDMIISRNNVSDSRILTKLHALTWQAQRDKYEEVLGPEDADKVIRLIQTVGIKKLRISLNVTSAAHSRELERENRNALAQTLITYARESLQLINQISGGTDPKTGAPLPASPEMAGAGVKWLRATQLFMRELVEMYPNINDAEPYVPDLATDIEASVKAKAAQGSALPSNEPPLAGAQLGPAGVGSGAILPFPQ